VSQIKFVNGAGAVAQVEPTRVAEATFPRVKVERTIQTAHVTPEKRYEELSKTDAAPGALLLSLGEQMKSLQARAERAEREAAGLTDTLARARAAANGVGRELEELRSSHVGLEERCERLAAQIKMHAAGAGEAAGLRERVAKLEEEREHTAVELKVLAQRAARAMRIEAEAARAIEEKRVAETRLSRVTSSLRDALVSHERAVDCVEGALRAAMERPS